MKFHIFSGKIATTLFSAVRNAKTVEHLVLKRSEDLICRNLFCEKVGEVCICRLSSVIEKLPNLKILDLSNNNFLIVLISVAEPVCFLPAPAPAAAPVFLPAPAPALIKTDFNF